MQPSAERLAMTSKLPADSSDEIKWSKQKNKEESVVNRHERIQCL